MDRRQREQLERAQTARQRNREQYTATATLNIPALTLYEHQQRMLDEIQVQRARIHLDQVEIQATQARTRAREHLAEAATLYGHQIDRVIMDELITDEARTATTVTTDIGIDDWTWAPAARHTWYNEDDRVDALGYAVYIDADGNVVKKNDEATEQGDQPEMNVYQLPRHGGNPSNKFHSRVQGSQYNRSTVYPLSRFASDGKQAKTTLIVCPKLMKTLPPDVALEITDESIPAYVHLNYLDSLEAIPKIFLNSVNGYTFVTSQRMKERAPSESARIFEKVYTQITPRLEEEFGPINLISQHIDKGHLFANGFTIADPTNIMVYKFGFNPGNELLSIYFEAERAHTAKVEVPDFVIDQIIEVLKKRKFGLPTELPELSTKYLNIPRQLQQQENQIASYRRHYTESMRVYSNLLSMEDRIKEAQVILDKAVLKLKSFIQEDSQFKHFSVRVENHDNGGVNLRFMIFREPSLMCPYTTEDRDNLLEALISAFKNRRGEIVDKDHFKHSVNFIMPRSIIVLKVHLGSDLKTVDGKAFITPRRDSEGIYRGHWDAQQVHPHAPGRERDPCYGDFGVPIADAFSKFDFVAVVQMLNIFCNTYNHHDMAGKYVVNWPLEEPPTVDKGD